MSRYDEYYNAEGTTQRVRCVATPVTDESDRPIVGISVSGPRG